MASSILSIGQSALAAAQVGISVTGHNIANASTPGYSRQVVTQAAAQAQNFGYGYVGQGTSVATINRVYNELLHNQMVNSQSTSVGIDTYATELSTVEAMLSDTTAGLNPTLNSFFSSLKALSANPSDIPSREAFLSNSQSLVNRFNTMGNRLNEIQADVNTQINGSMTAVNSYATQIARLNDVIDKAISTTGNQPNDLMDQRDLLISELSKQIKTTVVPQGQGSYNVFIGNGMPLVVGADTFQLTTVNSPTDSSRQEVAYVSNGNSTVLGKDSLVGGILGGLVQFRSESLDKVQNQLGQIALAMAETFNDQHNAGFDRNGAAGGDLFTIPAPTSQVKTQYDDGHTPGNATLNVSFTGPTVKPPNTVATSDTLPSDYKLKFDGTNYTITRLSDNTASPAGTLPQTIDGMTFSITAGAMAAGDEYSIRPTRNMASSIKLAISDPNKLAMAGSGDGVSNNTNGVKLAALQNIGIMKTAAQSAEITFSSSFSQLVGFVGNKSSELKVTGESERQVLASTKTAVEAESGVNLDEEAANLIRYQQAYQAAGKVMQIASELFDVLLSLG